MKIVDNPKDKIELIFNLKLINCKQQAKNFQQTGYFISDIDYQVAKHAYLQLSLNLYLFSNINPFKEYKIDKYVNCKRLYQQ